MRAAQVVVVVVHRAGSGPRASGRGARRARRGPLVAQRDPWRVAERCRRRRAGSPGSASANSQGRPPRPGSSQPSGAGDGAGPAASARWCASPADATGPSPRQAATRRRRRWRCRRRRGRPASRRRAAGPSSDRPAAGRRPDAQHHAGARRAGRPHDGRARRRRSAARRRVKRSGRRTMAAARAIVRAQHQEQEQPVAMRLGRPSAGRMARAPSTRGHGDHAQQRDDPAERRAQQHEQDAGRRWRRRPPTWRPAPARAGRPTADEQPGATSHRRRQSPGRAARRAAAAATRKTVDVDVVHGDAGVREEHALDQHQHGGEDGHAAAAEQQPRQQVETDGRQRAQQHARQPPAEGVAADVDAGHPARRRRAPGAGSRSSLGRSGCVSTTAAAGSKGRRHVREDRLPWGSTT